MIDPINVSAMTMDEFEDRILDKLNNDEDIDFDNLIVESNMIDAIQNEETDEVSFLDHSNATSSNVIELRSHHIEGLGERHQGNPASLAVSVEPLVPSTAQTNNAKVNMLPFSLAPDMPDGYALFPDGIYKQPADEKRAPFFLCTPLRVVAVFSDMQGRGHGKLVSIKVDESQWAEIPINNAELYSRPTAVLAALIDRGLEVAPGKENKKLLIEFIATSKPDRQLRTANQMGWVGAKYNAFCVGDVIIGRSDILPLMPATGVGAGLSIHGTVESWKENVGVLCRGNPMMILAVSLAFSGPLLGPLALSGGGLHFRGASSSGKTTLLRLASSVWGNSRLITQWRATSNGLEAIAVTLNDMLLPLDEIAEIQPRPLHEAIYTLANGTGKARMTKDSRLADQGRWRLAMISSGEISVEEKLDEGRLGVKAGQEVRLIDIEADSRAYGVFDALHGAARPDDFAIMIQKAATDHHGAPGHAFVKRLIAVFSQNPDSMKSSVSGIATSWINELPSAVDGQIARVATRFATIGLAGELATQMGLTGWDKSAARDAAKLAFFDWYDRRYGAKREAVNEYVKLLQRFLTDNLGQLNDLTRNQPDPSAPLGWRDATRAYLPQQVWSTIFVGVEGSKAAKALVEMQMLLPEAGRILRKAPRTIGLSPRPRLYAVRIDTVTAYKAE